MFGRVQKRRPAEKIFRRKELLAAVLFHSSDMPFCFYCESLGHASCAAFSQDFFRCVECFRVNRSGCDVLGLSPAELRNIVAQHNKLEAELEEAERKVFRLRQ